MPEIIRRNDPDNKFYTYNCKQCQSTLKARIDEGSFKVDRNEQFKVIACPVCKYNEWIPLNKFSTPKPPKVPDDYDGK